MSFKIFQLLPLWRAERSSQALERCRSILNAQGHDRDETLEVLREEMKRGVRLTKGATHLQVAGAASVLGAKLLDAAIEYLDARWQEASYHLQIESWLCSLPDDCRCMQLCVSAGFGGEAPGPPLCSSAARTGQGHYEAPRPAAAKTRLAGQGPSASPCIGLRFGPHCQAQLKAKMSVQKTCNSGP